MKLQSLSGAAFAISILLASSSPILARPVTTADLSGKMICWSGGVIQSFEADGKTATSKFADGAWSVGANGVRVDFPDGGVNVDIEIQPDGTFTSEYTAGGATQKGTGKICTGRPLSYADVEGKKLCWDGGDVETYFPEGKFINSSDGEGIIKFSQDGILEWNFKKYNKAFRGKEEQLEDGTVVYTGSWAGIDYGLTRAVFCK
jgi:hypothetical protein